MPWSASRLQLDGCLIGSWLNDWRLPARPFELPIWLAGQSASHCPQPWSSIIGLMWKETFVLFLFWHALTFTIPSAAAVLCRHHLSNCHHIKEKWDEWFLLSHSRYKEISGSDILEPDVVSLSGRWRDWHFSSSSISSSWGSSRLQSCPPWTWVAHRTRT